MRGHRKDARRLNRPLRTLSETVEAIQEKLQPSNIAASAAAATTEKGEGHGIQRGGHRW